MFSTRLDILLDNLFQVWVKIDLIWAVNEKRKRSPWINLNSSSPLTPDIRCDPGTRSKAPYHRSRGVGLQRLEKNCAYRLTIWSLRLPGNFRGEKKAGNHNAVRDISIESCSISWQKTWHHRGWDWLRLLSQQSHWYCHIFTPWKKVDFDSLKNIAEVTYFHFIINSHPN